MTLKRLRRRLHRCRADRRRDTRAIKKLKRLIRRLRRRGPRVMYDSVDVSQIPRDAKAAAGYVGGAWPTYANGELAKRCPHARLVSVAVSSRHHGMFLDIEAGDATISDAPGWWRRNGSAEGFYISAGMADSLVRYLDTHGIKRRSYKLFTAHYGRGRHICGPRSCGEMRSTRADATQWINHAMNRNLDESLCRPSFWD